MCVCVCVCVCVWRGLLNAWYIYICVQYTYILNSYFIKTQSAFIRQNSSWNLHKKKMSDFCKSNTEDINEIYLEKGRF